MRGRKSLCKFQEEARGCSGEGFRTDFGDGPRGR